MDGSSDSVESPHFLCPESYSYGSISSPTFSMFPDDSEALLLAADRSQELTAKATLTADRKSVV